MSLETGLLIRLLARPSLSGRAPGPRTWFNGQAVSRLDRSLDSLVMTGLTSSRIFGFNQQASTRYRRVFSYSLAIHKPTRGPSTTSLTSMCPGLCKLVSRDSFPRFTKQPWVPFILTCFFLLLLSSFLLFYKPPATTVAAAALWLGVLLIFFFMLARDGMSHFDPRAGRREPDSPDTAGRSGRSEGQQFRHTRNAHAREGIFHW